MITPFANILLPIDLNQESSWHKALPVTIRLARDFGAKVRIMTVVPDTDWALGFPDAGRQLNERLVRETVERLDGLVREQLPDEIEVDQVVRQGSIHREILKLARETQPDLIVMASHRPKRADFLLGMNAAEVVRHALCSVMVVREEPSSNPWAVLP